MNDNDVTELENEIMTAAGKLATEVAPASDLWPGIEAAITEPAQPRKSAWNSVWAQAAAVLILVGGSSGLTYLAMSDSSYKVPLAGNGLVPKVFEPVDGSFGSQYNLGSEYQVAHNELGERLNDQLDRLPAETRDDVQKNIQTIRAAIRDINIALAEEPDNVLLQELLLSSYREEMDLMIRVDGLTTIVMRRTDM